MKECPHMASESSSAEERLIMPTRTPTKTEKLLLVNPQVKLNPATIYSNEIPSVIFPENLPSSLLSNNPNPIISRFSFSLLQACFVRNKDNIIKEMFVIFPVNRVTSYDVPLAKTIDITFQHYLFNDLR